MVSRFGGDRLLGCNDRQETSLARTNEWPWSGSCIREDVSNRLRNVGRASACLHVSSRRFARSNCNRGFARLIV